MILLQINFEISPEKQAAFEQMYVEAYVPALKKLRGYIGSKLIRVFPPQVAQEIEAAPTRFNYQMHLTFDSEANRRHWVGSQEHNLVWPLAESMAMGTVTWQGFDILASDTMIQ